MFTSTNCSKEGILDPRPLKGYVDSLNCDNFNEQVQLLPFFQQPDPIPDPTVVGEPVTEEQEDYKCTYLHIKYSPEYDELYLLDPKSGVIWISNFLDGNTISNGAYTPISNLSKAPITISISLPTKPGEKPLEEVLDPSLSNVRDAINKLIKRVAPGPIDAFINFEIQEVHSKEEAALMAQTNISGWGAKVSVMYDFNSKTEQTKILMKFYQKYYTIDLDLPNRPCDMFISGNLPTPEIFNGTSPVYVSSITYGRLVYLMVESNVSAQALRAAMTAAYKAWGVNASAGIEQQHTDVLNQSKISALVVGGNSDTAPQAIEGVEGVKQFLQEGGSFTENTPGVPMAYTMRFLKDNSIAKVVLTSEYTVRNCELTGEEFTFSPNNNNGEGYYYCAQPDPFSLSDGDFGTHGPQVDGKIELLVENGNEIWAKVHVTWEEFIGDKTKGYVDEMIHLYTLPTGKQFVGFTTDKSAYFSYTDENFEVDTPPVTGGDFIERVEVVGDTHNGDFECNGNLDSNIRIFFKKITILMKNL